MSKRVAKTRAKGKNVDRIVNEKHIGFETTDWSDVKEEDLERAKYDNLRNYSVFHGNKPAKEWATSWVKKHRKKDLAKMKKISDWEIGTTVGGLCKMHLDGCPLRERDIAFINKRLDERFEMIQPEEKKVDVGPTFSKVEYQVSNLIALIDNVIDDRDAEFSVIENLQGESFSRPMAQKVLDYFMELARETKLLVDRDPDVVECYENLKTAKERRDYHKFISTLVSDIEQYINNLDAVRATRKKTTRRTKKMKSKAELSKAFKFKQTDNTYNLTSHHPEKLIGASVAYLFNTKTRKLIQLKSAEAEGLTIKASSIINITTSGSKTVRKPEETIKEILGSTKSKAEKVYAELTTKDGKASALGNSDLMILKVFL